MTFGCVTLEDSRILSNVKTLISRENIGEITKKGIVDVILLFFSTENN